MILREAIEAGEDIPFDHVTSVEDGAGEVLLTLASALGPESFALFYARLAQIVRPDYVEAYLFTADLFSDQGAIQALAVADFEQVPESSVRLPQRPCRAAPMRLQMAAMPRLRLQPCRK